MDDGKTRIINLLRFSNRLWITVNAVQTTFWA
ncbi:Uncharacterised protein [Vibrio cholerae]|nr:Uncharacterised protein [Vibrio cholerae]